MMAASMEAKLICVCVIEYAFAVGKWTRRTQVDDSQIIAVLRIMLLSSANK